MKIDSEKIFIDTNILLYASFEKLGYQKIVQSILLENDNLYISRQVLLEYINNFTNNKIIKNVQIDSLFKSINHYLSFIHLIDDYNFSINELYSLIKKYDIRGRRIFDLKIILDMQKNNIKTIVTANEKDFYIFKDIKVINPFSMNEVKNEY